MLQNGSRTSKETNSFEGVRSVSAPSAVISPSPGRPMVDSHSPLRVTDWNTKFETHRTRELRSLLWIPVPNDLAGESYLWLIDHENGAQHLGGCVAILMVVSRSPRPYRGFLQLENGAPHDAKSLARATRLPEQLFEELLPRLLQIGLLEPVTNKPRKSKELPSRNPAQIPRDVAQTPRTNRSEAKRRNGREGTEAAANGTGQNENRSTHIAAADIDRFRTMLDLTSHLGKP